MSELRLNRAAGLMVIAAIYVAAAAIGIMAFRTLAAIPMVWRIFTADVLATLFVWALGLVFHNSSIYDPYWSIAPCVIIPLIAVFSGYAGTGSYLMIVGILFWGFRLTLNWAHTFKNLATQDWRYTSLRKRAPELWFLTNLFGIHLFPTMVVFLVMLPAIQFVSRPQELNAGVLLGMLICLGAVWLQIVSDRQMHRFRRDAENAGQVMCEGLWQYSRHPNYLGEILMWWGIYVMALAAGASPWWTLLCPLSNTLMFLGISIPLMENRLSQSKAGYAEYQANTGMLLPRSFSLRSKVSTIR